MQLATSQRAPFRRLQLASNDTTAHHMRLSKSTRSAGIAAFCVPRSVSISCAHDWVGADVPHA